MRRQLDTESDPRIVLDLLQRLAELSKAAGDPLLAAEAYATLADVPEVPDVALLAVPAALTEQAVIECIEKGVRGALIFSAGYAESGEDGLAEAFEDVGDGVEAGFDAVHLRQQLVQFGGDDFLFG